MARIPAVALSLVLAAAGLSGCALFDDIGGSDLDDALELVPGDATSIAFVDREVVAERIGATGQDVDAYLQTMMDAGGVTTTTRFTIYVDRMVDRAAFSDLDIVWEATATAGGGSKELPRIYKLNDELDLDDVGDELVAAGYQQDQIAGYRHFFVDQDVPNTNGMVGAYPGIEMLEVVLVPDEHLMFAGDSTSMVQNAVDVFEDDVDSATDVGAFDELLDGADDPEYALLHAEPRCDEPGENGVPEAAGFFISGDAGDGNRVLAFADGSVETDDYSGDEFSAC